MARYHGHKGTIYLATTSGGVASNRNDCRSWELNFPSDKAKVTALEDGHHVYAKGKKDPKGKVSAFWDPANVKALHDAAGVEDGGVAFYLYPSRANATRYFYGTTWVDLSRVGGSTEGAIEIDIDLTPAAADWTAQLP